MKKRSTYSKSSFLSTILMMFLSFTVCQSDAQIIRKTIKPIDVSKRSFAGIAGSKAGLYQIDLIKDNNNVNKNRIKLELRLWNEIYWRTVDTILLDSGAQIRQIKVNNAGVVHIFGKFNYQIDQDISVYRNLLIYNGKWAPLKVSSNFEPRDEINDVAFLQDTLFIAGQFDSFGGVFCGNIAKYFDGKIFTVKDYSGTVGLDSAVNYIEVRKGFILASGKFANAGKTSSKAISYLKNDTWQKVTAPFVQGLHFIPLSDQNYYIAGQNVNGEINMFSMNIKNQTFTNINQGTNKITDFHQFELYNNELYAVGDFNLTVGGFRTGFIQYENSVWKSINGNQSAQFIDSFNSTLYIVGVKLLNYLSNSNGPFIASYKPSQKLIFGNLFLDANNNCVRDAGERPIAQKNLKFGDDKNTVTTDEMGVFRYYFEDSSNKMPSLLLDNKFFTFDLCIKDSNLFKNPPNHVNGPFDIAISTQAEQRAILDTRIIAHGGKRIQKNGRKLVTYLIRNVGLNDATDIKVVLGGTQKMKNIFSVPPFQIENDTSISWKLSDIQAFGFQAINISFALQDNVDVLDKSLDFNVNYSYNNSVQVESGEDFFLQQVTNDDYTVLKEQNTQQNQQGDVASIAATDTVIEYQISFQNRTNSIVTDVVIIDTLNLLHDFKYTQEITSSHPFSTEVKQDVTNPNIGYLIWTFNDINLTSNPGGSPEITSDQGFIEFKFVFNKLNKNEVVKNTALVIMNGNYQYSTNSVVCNVDRLVNVTKTTNTLNQKIYPNPVSTTLHILSNQTSYQYEIIDALGKVILSGNQNDNSTINVSSLLNGIYLLRMVNDQSATILRFVKE